MVASIFDLSTASPADLAEIPPEKLLLFQGAIASYAADAARLANVLHGALVARYATGLNGTGTHNVDDGTVAVSVTIPKKVKWDQQKLLAAIDVIRGWGENPGDYVDTEIKVAERRYEAWPPPIRDLFAPARTLETGKPVFKLTLREAE